MAAGNAYGADIVNANGQVQEGATIQFLDSIAQPLGSTLPIIVNGAALPTSDPHVVGQLWANSHVVTVSAG
jgi:hypothetical protein